MPILCSFTFLSLASAPVGSCPVLLLLLCAAPSPCPSGCSPSAVASPHHACESGLGRRGRESLRAPWLEKVCRKTFPFFRNELKLGFEGLRKQNSAKDQPLTLFACHHPTVLSRSFESLTSCCYILHLVESFHVFLLVTSMLGYLMHLQPA